MKVSVSLPAEDIEYLDQYARERQLGSRSAALHQAVRLLRVAQLGTEYGDAWDEWAQSGDEADWEQTAPDGLTR
jgi:Arc/MetJ-type ribon-helix-helix transcriptional regulator